MRSDSDVGGEVPQHTPAALEVGQHDVAYSLENREASICELFLSAGPQVLQNGVPIIVVTHGSSNSLRWRPPAAMIGRVPRVSDQEERSE
jgi:hypothetical protein